MYFYQSFVVVVVVVVMQQQQFNFIFVSIGFSISANRGYTIYNYIKFKNSKN